MPLLRRILPMADFHRSLERARRLAGLHHVPTHEVVSPAFLRRHSRFSHLDQMREAYQLSFVSEDLTTGEAVDLRGRWETAIRESTDFASWEEMRQAAATEWVRERLSSDEWSTQSAPKPPRLLPDELRQRNDNLQDRDNAWPIPEASFIPTEVDEDDVELVGYRAEFFSRLKDIVVLPFKVEVHHIKWNQFREMYREFDGIDVDDPKYLRGVPEEIHRQINGPQSTTRAGLYRELGVKDGAQAMKRFRKDPSLWQMAKKKYLEPFERKVKELWGDYMIDATKSKDSIRERVRGLNRFLKDRKKLDRLFLQNRARAAKFLAKIGVLGGFAALAGIFATGAEAMEAIYASGNEPTSEQHLALRAFLNRYDAALTAISERGTLTLNEREHLKRALTAWLRSIGIDLTDGDFVWIAREMELWTLPGHEARTDPF